MIGIAVKLATTGLASLRSSAVVFPCSRAMNPKSSPSDSTQHLRSMTVHFGGSTPRPRVWSFHRRVSLIGPPTRGSFLGLLLALGCGLATEVFAQNRSPAIGSLSDTPRNSLEVDRLLSMLDETLPWQPGWWFIDSCGSDASSTPSDGFGRRETFQASPRQLNAGEQAGIALVGTQRLALYAAASSQFSLGTFEQKGFSQALAHDRAFEPSRSRTTLGFQRGRFAVTWATPNPTSRLRLELPGVTLQSEASALAIELTETHQGVFVASGTIQATPDGSSSPVLLSDGWYLDLRVLRRASITEASQRALPSVLERVAPLLDAAGRAQQRVWFFAVEEDLSRPRSADVVEASTGSDALDRRSTSSPSTPTAWRGKVLLPAVALP